MNIIKQSSNAETLWEKLTMASGHTAGQALSDTYVTIVSAATIYQTPWLCPSPGVQTSRCPERVMATHGALHGDWLFCQPMGLTGRAYVLCPFQ